MPIRWGILSTARINDNILAAAKRSDAAEVVAVASRDGATAKAYAEKNGVPRAFAGYDALLADPAIDAVYISLPNSMHTEWSIGALRAGKHVLCEKPLTRHAADARKIFDAAKASGRLAMEGFMYRHHPQTKRLRDLVAGGAIGKLLFVCAALSFELKGPDIRLSRDLEGGAMMDLGCYCLSSMRLIAGEPTAVIAAERTTADGVDTRFFATLDFGEDVVGQFDVAMTMPFRSQLEIVGSDGIMIIDDPWIAARPGIEIRRGSETEKIAFDPVDHYQLELENMARAIGGKEPPLLGRDDAVDQARAIEALYRSAGSGRRVALSEVAA